jgi:cell wall-associated NlpC family hydrolase
MAIASVSSISSQFPNTEVEYEDLIGIRWVRDGRTREEGMDCLGVILEAFRRAGLALPDPKHTGRIEDFTDIFEEVAEPNTLFDIINLRGSINHLLVVIREGLALSSREGGVGGGVYSAPIANVIRCVSIGVPVRYWRVRLDSLPS